MLSEGMAGRGYKTGSKSKVFFQDAQEKEDKMEKYLRI